ncbi:hypothetical protein FHX42_000639 [Saccharopolyspora lacisalsi]|uniref:Excreted virulence factor EspC, type VII ESX diderm n=1 Tax=Halosaccharopolyspora lacisalsi TaxID=1000566 RepID=A0A839DQS3_9PSEU|nr:type VII secretion target [Halosaccharopolyspora lacisalsi]MBA8823310.1 hypothetical protein [Halosaccharopolyspora lacisalsi]
MGDGEGFETSTEELRGHAKKLRALADRLDTAVGAAEQVTMSTEAYGKICAFFVPIVQGVSRPGVDALSRASEAMNDTASNVRRAASTYDETESGNDALLREIEP